MSPLLLLLATIAPAELEPPPSDEWAVHHVETTVDELGIEVLAFDAVDELIGTMLFSATLDPDADSDVPLVRVDASFLDGYASAWIVAHDQVDAADALAAYDSDLDANEAARRVTTMLSLVPLDAGPLDVGLEGQQGPTRRQCQVKFAVAAAICAGAAFTANPGIAFACVANQTNVICDCKDYIPIKICD